MRSTLISILAATRLFASTTQAQVLPDYDLGGASRPKPDMKFRDENQYKRVHQTALRFVLRGEVDKTETFLEQYLSEHPGDAETLYMLGLLNAQKGQLDKAEDFLRQALEAGLPPGRLIAGPRTMLQPLADTALMKELHEKFSARPVHGPLLGNLTGDRASFWVRTATEGPVEILVRPADDPDAEPISGRATSSGNRDFTAVVTVDGLKPQTSYRYAVGLNGHSHILPVYQFTTPAAAGQPSAFRIAFGGGAGYVPENERMWNTIRDTDPDAILLLGDNVYIDDPESEVMQRYTYQRRQSRPEWRRLTAACPVYTIWDDHDFSTNDSWGGAQIDVPFWKKDYVFEIFRQNWANPGYGGGDDQPGCWYSFQIGDVDFIMLDCRYYRTSPRQEPRSMLGPVQKQWLKQQLAEATGTFKVICSSVPWDFRTKGDSLDTWNGYKQEHEEILSFIDQRKIQGVVLMSADRHRSDAWKLSRPNGYDLYEFNSSRLTNQHVHPTMEKQGAIFSYNKPQSFGLVSFDTTLNDPQVTYEVVNIDGERPHSITVKRSELQTNR